MTRRRKHENRFLDGLLYNIDSRYAVNVCCSRNRTDKMKEYNFEKTKLIDIHYEDDIHFGTSCMVTFRISEMNEKILKQIEKIARENPKDFVCNINHNYEARLLKVELHRIDGR